MMRLYKTYVCLLAMWVGGANAYVPTTWIDRVPHNIYNPICFSTIQHDKNKLSSVRANIRPNCFAIAQWGKFTYGPCLAYGIALQGQLPMNTLLTGLYGQFNASALMNYEKNYDQVSHKVRYSNLAALDDTHFLIGWNAINKQRVYFSGYAFGIIPATKHSLFNANKIINWVGLDNHFAWGVGVEFALRLLEKQQHHIDWINNADVTFLERRKGMAWVCSNATYNLYPIEICSNQQYKIRSTFAYQYKKFISDIGIHYVYTPNLKHATPLDITLQKIVEPSSHCASLVGDVGRVMQLCHVSSFVSFGAQVTEYNYRYYSWNAHGKFGITF